MLQFLFAAFILGHGAAQLPLHFGKVILQRPAGGRYGFRGHIAFVVIQVIAQVQLFPVCVGQLVQRRGQAVRQNGQQHRTRRQIFHPRHNGVNLRLARSQLRPGDIHRHHLAFSGFQLCFAFAVLLFILLVLLLLPLQLGASVLQLLFPVGNLLSGVGQLIGGVGQLLLSIGQLALGVRYFFPGFRQLFVQVILHLLHPQGGALFRYRLQRRFQRPDGLVVFFGIAVQRCGIFSHYI